MVDKWSVKRSEGPFTAHEASAQFVGTSLKTYVPICSDLNRQHPGHVWADDLEKVAVLADPFIAPGPPACIKTSNSTEFIAATVQKWFAKAGVASLYFGGVTVGERL